VAPPFSLTELLAQDLAAIEARQLRRHLRTVSTAQGPLITLDGRTVINLSSNNYLALADHPALVRAAAEALEAFGVGAGAARLIAGNQPPHLRLEAALASFHQREAALLFNSGYQANVGVLSALAGPDDVLFSDQLNHASIIDGCRLARAQIRVYSHADPADLERALIGSPGRRRFIVTDTLFSMDGDLAPLAELRRLADRHGAFLVVDEAHATGVLGPDGRGLADAIGVRADVHIATLGKALGAFGAYVTGDRALIDYLLHRARSFVFTTALPASVAAAAHAALAIAAGPEGSQRRARLEALIARLAAGLRERKLLVAGAGVTPIFPILAGNDGRALAATAALLEHGLYAQAIRPPTVPAGTARLRLALTAGHEPAHVDQTLAALDDLVARGLIERLP
jgi:8-amino-7-oxononanoate synthase